MGFLYTAPVTDVEKVEAAIATNSTTASKKPKKEFTIAPEGNYSMKVNSVRGKITKSGRKLVELFLTHTAEGNSFKGATLTLWESKTAADVFGPSFIRTQIGIAMGLEASVIASLNFAIDADAEAGTYGELPAVLLDSEGNEYDITDLELSGVVTIEEYEGRNGAAKKNVVDKVFAPKA